MVNTTSIITCGLIMILLLTGCSETEPSATQKDVQKAPALTYVVAGYGKVFYEANTCDLVFAVVTHNDDVMQCHKVHEEAVASVTKYIKDISPKKTIAGQSSTKLSIHTKLNKVKFYLYETVFSMRMKGIEKLSSVQSELVQRGVNKIISFDLLSDNESDLVFEARRLAIDDAKKKAQFVASQAGWEIIGIYNIVYNETPYQKSRMARTFGSRASVSQDMSSMAAETFVDSSMTVTFEYKKIK